MNLIRPLLAAALFGLTAPWCQAQMVTVDDPNSAIWDLTTVNELKEVWLESDDGDVEIDLNVEFTQSGSGKLAGTGTSETYMSSSEGNQTFPATYTVSGSISSSRGVARLSRKVAANGTANLNGAPRKVKLTQTIAVTVNNATGGVAGTTTMKASASGVGGFSGKESFDDAMPPSAGDGSWQLEVMRTVSGAKVTGQATLVPDAGGEVEFAIKGSYKAKTNTSTLTLTGLGTSKGASLKVTMVGDQITVVSGKVAGQTVSWKKPV
jgi:hypothetical protein